MSGYFDGRNGRLSRTWRLWRCGKSVKTLGDSRDLGDLQFEEISWNWKCCRFTWQVLKSVRNQTSHQVGGCLEVSGDRLDVRSLWSLYKMHETLWFCLVSVNGRVFSGARESDCAVRRIITAAKKRLQNLLYKPISPLHLHLFVRNFFQLIPNFPFN